jgi:signal transduction histidine kinase
MPDLIRGDAARVHQVVWNLVSNAIKFTPSGGTVTVELSEDERWVELRVRDTGVGIEPEFIPHVFERFRQEDGARTGSHDGLGLGLAITRHLVQLHGGTVAAESGGPGTGALFVVRFPIVPQTAGRMESVGPPVPHLVNGPQAHRGAGLTA